MPPRPIKTPWTAKVNRILGGPAPRVRRIAMSVCFSFTIMTSVATMLKAATPTIMKRMMNIIFFMLSMERKKIS